MDHGSANGRDIASLARMLADDTRASVCDALMDGRAWTAGELASAVGVTAATMSEHLNRLVGSGLLVEERQGRHRYLRLADLETAQLLEMLGSRAGGAATTSRRVAAGARGGRPHTRPDVL